MLNKWKNYFKNPLSIIGLILLVFLFCTIIIPLLEILFQSFKWDARTAMQLAEGESSRFTIYYWKRVLGSEISQSLFYKPMLNSLAIGISVASLSLVLGGTLAWVVTRTDFAYKKTVSFLAVLPYMLPSWVVSFAWIAIFKNDRIGGSLGLVQAFFNINPPDWLAYGYVPIVITLTLNYFTFFFLLMSVALSSINSSLEETAEIMGASKMTVLRKITFPLVMPAILSAFILTFSKSLGSFGVPAFLGLPIKYYTISTMLHSSMQNRMISEAYILSIILLMICATMIFFNQKAMGQRKSFATIGGKNGRKSLYILKKWKKPITVVILGFMGMVAFIPLLILILQSFMLMEGNFNLNNFTLHFWIGDSNSAIASGEVGVLKNTGIILALKNSLKVAFSASLVASFIGLFMGYIIVKGRKNLLSKMVEQISFLPYLIPGIAFSAIYLSMFATPSFFFIPALYGSITLVILICTVNELPFATRSGISNMFQIGKELEEAALMMGASWHKRFLHIILPLCKKGLFSSFLLLFISVMKELDLLILLITPQTGTLTTLIFKYAEQGYGQFANAIMLIIVTIILITFAVAKKIGKVDFSKGIGG